MPRTAVNVLNSNDFTIEDRYDGVLYTFAPGTALTIPVEAAKHILGFNEETRQADFLHVQRRWGWNVKDAKNDTLSHAKEWFKNIIVRPVYFETVEIVSMSERKPRSSSPERKRELTRQ
jgi:hypothetical protein